MSASHLSFVFPEAFQRLVLNSVEYRVTELLGPSMLQPAPCVRLETETESTKRTTMIDCIIDNSQCLSHICIYVFDKYEIPPAQDIKQIKLLARYPSQRRWVP